MRLWTRKQERTVLREIDRLDREFRALENERDVLREWGEGLQRERDKLRVRNAELRAGLERVVEHARKHFGTETAIERFVTIQVMSTVARAALDPSILDEPKPQSVSHQAEEGQ